MVILILFAISESSFLVTYFSRFSEEVFTGIVVCFFIYEASKNILDVRLSDQPHPSLVSRWFVPASRAVNNSLALFPGSL